MLLQVLKVLGRVVWLTRAAGSNSGTSTGTGTQPNQSRAALPEGKVWFEPTNQWQPVLGNHVCPTGCQFRIDVSTNTKQARLVQRSSSAPATREGGGSGGGFMAWISGMVAGGERNVGATAGERIALKRARIKAERLAKEQKGV